ncbi:MAG: hypothetical protein R3E66_00220 [bacterium]
MTDIDVQVVSKDEAYASDFQFGYWYISRTVSGKPYGKTSLLARGRFPVPCGDGCVWFVAESGSGYWAHRMHANEIVESVNLGTEPPVAFTVVLGKIVVAYPDRVEWPQTNTRREIKGVQKLVPWAASLVVVRTHDLLILRSW